MPIFAFHSHHMHKAIAAQAREQPQSEVREEHVVSYNEINKYYTQVQDKKKAASPRRRNYLHPMMPLCQHDVAADHLCAVWR